MYVRYVYAQKLLLK